MTKIMVAIIFGIFLISLVSATQSLGTFKQGDCIQLIQTCATCTYNNISSVVQTGSNPQIYTTNSQMTKDDTFYNYTFCNTSVISTYLVNGFGNPDGIKTEWVYNFDISYSGQTLSFPQAIIYTLLMGIIFFIFMMVMFFINKLPSSNAQDEEGKILSINYLKYARSALWFVEWVLFITILFLSSNIAFAYLGEQLFAKTLFVLFRISLGLTPLVVTIWIVWIFVKMFHDKQFQKLLNRGFFPEGKL